MLLRLLLCVVIGVALPGLAAASAPSPPLAPGATWTYRYTVARPSEAPVVGTLTTRYDGPVVYRGQQCYAAAVSDTITPDVKEQDYYEWTGTHFRQIALRTVTGNAALEIVFDATVPLDTAQRASGTARTFLNGADQGSIPWSTVIRPLGTATVTVPAGTFLNVPRWETTFRFGAIRQVQIAAVLGLVDLRVDSDYYVSDVLRSTAREELLSGPVR